MPPSPDPEHSIRRVLQLSAPIGLAFIPLGMVLGFLVVHAGLDWWWAPVATVALTTLVVNSRHIFYALSFPLQRVKGLPAKLYRPTRSPTRRTPSASAPKRAPEPPIRSC